MTRSKPDNEKIGAIAPFGLRMLPELRAKIDHACIQSGRSMNAEIVARLNESMSGGGTLRDDFAMAALTGLCMSQLTDAMTFDTIAANAYRAADSMLLMRGVEL